MERSFSALYASLDDNERILWSGAASTSASILNGYDIILIPFSFIWGAGMIFGLVTFLLALVKTPNPGLVLPLLFLLPMAAFGAYFSVGRLIFKNWRQQNCYYAITAKRVLIAVGDNVRSLPLAGIKEIKIVRKNSAGIGTIRLGPLPWWNQRENDDGLDIISLLRGTGVPTIWDIDDVEAVYHLLRGRWLQAKAGLR